MKLRTIVGIIIVVAVAGAVGCQSVKAPTIDQQLYAANQTVTSVEIGTKAALEAGLITKAQAQSVSSILHQVNPLLDIARAAETSNPTTAANTLGLVNQLLAGLQAYVPVAKSSAPQ